MLSVSDIRKEDMPPDMGILLDKYPRDSWETHPGFKEKTKAWLGAHQMFRRLTDVTRNETELFLDKARSVEHYVSRLSYYGNALVRNLHGHHGWEDQVYFPELSAADPRFGAGLDLLIKDHETLNNVLDRFTTTANKTIKLLQLEESQPSAEAAELHGITREIEVLLQRHLSDEEDLAVPIILHHRLRG